MKEMLRRDGKLAKRGVIPALCLSLLLAALLGTAGFAVLSSASRGRSPVTVALVDEEDSLISRLCINLVESQSYIESLMTFEAAEDEEEALEGLREGRFSAVILLPKGYTANIMQGIPASGKVILSRAATAEGETIEQVAAFGQRLLTAGQLGVFVGQQLLWDKDLDSYMSAFLLDNNGALIDFVLSVFDESFTVEVTDYDDSGLSLTAYYALTWFSFFLFLLGLLFRRLCTADLRGPLLQRLFAAGIRPRDFLLGKCLYPFLFRLLLSLPILWGFSRLMPLRLTPPAILSALLGLLLVSLLVSVGYVLPCGRFDATGPWLLLSLLSLLLCGGLVPRALLPRFLLTAGSLSPLGAVMNCLSPLFGGPFALLPFAAGAVYAALGLWLCLRRLSLLKPEGGEL